MSSSELCSAVSGKDLSQVLLRLQQGEDVNATTGANGWGPLHFACYLGLVDIAKLLIAHKADINRSKQGGDTPLFLACYQNHIELVKLLCSISQTEMDKPSGDDGLTPLMGACLQGHYGIVELLLSNASVDPNKVSLRGITSLLAASTSGQTSIVARLLRAGADPNLSSSDVGTALHVSAQENRLEILSLLLRANADPNVVRKPSFATPLLLACERGHSGAVELLLKAGARVDASMRIATALEKKEKSSSSASAFEGEGEEKQFRWMNALSLAVRAKSLDTVKMLLDAGASVKPPTAIGSVSAMQIACEKGYLAAVEMLLSYGADPSQPVSGDGSTPLLIACQRGHAEIAKVLLSRGASHSLPNQSGTSPLQAAAGQLLLDVVRLLLEKGAQPHPEVISAAASHPQLQAILAKAIQIQQQQQQQQQQHQQQKPPTPQVTPSPPHHVPAPRKATNPSLPSTLPSLAPSPLVLPEFKPSKQAAHSPSSSSSSSPSATHSPSPLALPEFKPKSVIPSPSPSSPLALPPFTIKNASKPSGPSLVNEDSFAQKSLMDTTPPSHQKLAHDFSASSAPQPLPFASSLPDALNLDGILIRYEDLRFLRPIGEGAFGEIWQARYKGSTVAVKKLKSRVSHMDERTQAEFRNETRLQARLRHPNIVLFLGVALDSQNRELLVSEFMEGGSLASQLYVVKRLNPLRTKLRLAVEIARGLNFLHCQTPSPILHRDLKPENILVDSDCAHAKVADLGLARVKSSIASMHSFAGSPYYMAPEQLRDESYDCSADVYSFGLVTFEIFASRRPYPTSWAFPQLYKQVALSHHRPEIAEEETPLLVKQLITRCWHKDANARPKMEEVIFVLENML